MKHYSDIIVRMQRDERVVAVGEGPGASTVTIIL